MNHLPAGRQVALIMVDFYIEIERKKGSFQIIISEGK